MKKRILSFILLSVLLITNLPLSAFAVNLEETCDEHFITIVSNFNDQYGFSDADTLLDYLSGTGRYSGLQHAAFNVFGDSYTVDTICLFNNLTYIKRFYDLYELEVDSTCKSLYERLFYPQQYSFYDQFLFGYAGFVNTISVLYDYLFYDLGYTYFEMDDLFKDMIDEYCLTLELDYVEAILEFYKNSIVFSDYYVTIDDPSQINDYSWYIIDDIVQVPFDYTEDPEEFGEVTYTVTPSFYRKIIAKAYSGEAQSEYTFTPYTFRDSWDDIRDAYPSLFVAVDNYVEYIFQAQYGNAPEAMINQIVARYGLNSVSDLKKYFIFTQIEAEYAYCDYFYILPINNIGVSWPDNSYESNRVQKYPNQDPQTIDYLYEGFVVYPGPSSGCSYTLSSQLWTLPSGGDNPNLNYAAFGESFYDSLNSCKVPYPYDVYSVSRNEYRNVADDLVQFVDLDVYSSDNKLIYDFWSYPSVSVLSSEVETIFSPSESSAYLSSLDYKPFVVISSKGSSPSLIYNSFTQDMPLEDGERVSITYGGDERWLDSVSVFCSDDYFYQLSDGYPSYYCGSSYHEEINPREETNFFVGLTNIHKSEEYPYANEVLNWPDYYENWDNGVRASRVIPVNVIDGYEGDSYYYSKQYSDRMLFASEPSEHSLYASYNDFMNESSTLPENVKPEPEIDDLDDPDLIEIIPEVSVVTTIYFEINGGEQFSIDVQQYLSQDYTVSEAIDGAYHLAVEAANDIVISIEATGNPVPPENQGGDDPDGPDDPDDGDLEGIAGWLQRICNKLDAIEATILSWFGIYTANLNSGSTDGSDIDLEEMDETYLPVDSSGGILVPVIISNNHDTTENADKFSLISCVILLAYAVLALLFLVRVAMLLLTFEIYIAHIFAIPASGSFLPDGFRNAIQVLKGYAVLGLDEPIHIIELGNGRFVSIFDFMVVIFEIAMIGAAIKVIRRFVDRMPTDF